MSRGLRQSQATLHTWSGLLLGWVLFTVFVTGTIAFWREPLNRYMRPELARVEDPAAVLAGAQRFLERTAPDATTWYITMPSDRTPGATVFWVPKPTEGQAPRRRGRRDTQAVIGADGAPVVARETRGGEFFYRFHFDLHYMPVLWARWIVGVAAMMMLVAILSGIVTHKKIFRDFFTMRRGKGQRSWLDGHNASAVLALPFHLMITYTGIVSLMAMLMPWAGIANYSDQDRMFHALFPHLEEPAPTGRRVPTAALTQITQDASRRLGGPPGFIEVSGPGDAAARVTVSRAAASQLGSYVPSVTYDGATGRAIWQSPPQGGGIATASVMIGLHAGRYADAVLRWIYFLCGIAGTLMVASGLVLWTVKRRERLPDPARPPIGFRIVERLNIATIAGFPLGIAAMLWANRLLPTEMAGRADREVAAMFAAWGLAAVAACVGPSRMAWTRLLVAAGAAAMLLPVYNLAATGRGLPQAMAEGDMALVGADLTLLAIGGALLLVARRVAGHRAAPRRVRTPRVTAMTMTPEPAE